MLGAATQLRIFFTHITQVRIFFIFPVSFQVRMLYFFCSRKCEKIGTFLAEFSVFSFVLN